MTARANGKVNRRGEVWEDAYERVSREYPSVNELWPKSVAPRGLLRLISALVPKAPEVRRGFPIPPTTEAISEVVGDVFRDQLGVGGGAPPPEQYTSKPFAEAFRELVGARTAMQVSRRTGIASCGHANSGVHPRRVLRLLNGESRPTGLEMEWIARAFGKQASYFREYREIWIAMAVVKILERNPSHSAAIVHEMAL